MNALALTAIVVGALVLISVVVYFVRLAIAISTNPDNDDTWEYGTCRGSRARRHRKTGAVQFVLWRAGERGHMEDYWHSYDRTWWPQFETSE